MVETEHDGIIQIPALRWPEIKRARFRYLGNDGGHKNDRLTALFVEDCPAVYADVNGELGIRYDPETGHVSGVEIRGFEDSFLCQQHPELAAEWAALKPEAPDGIHSSGWLSSKGATGLARCLQEAVKGAATGPDWVARQLHSLEEHKEYTAFILSRASAEIPPLKWPEIQRVMYWYTGVLDDGIDTDSLLMLFVDNRFASSIDADEDLLIRYDHETGDVAGIAIENFEHHFLKKHPELADGWVALKPEGNNGFHNGPWLADRAALDYARRLKDMAYQGTLAPGWPVVDRGDILLWSKFGVPV